MFKIVFILGITLAQVLTASNIYIKDYDVSIQINGKESLVKVGISMLVKQGDTICFINGKGRVLINNEVQLHNNTSNKCYQIPFNKGFKVSNWIKDKKDWFVTNVISSKEKVVAGASKSLGEFEFDTIYIVPEQQYLIVFSEKFGPLEVTLLIKDEKGQTIHHFINEENDITFFKIDKSILKNNYTLEVKNGFDDTLVKPTKIIIE